MSVIKRSTPRRSQTINQSIKRGVGDRARALYDTQYLKEEFKNVEQVFIEMDTQQDRCEKQ